MTDLALGPLEGAFLLLLMTAMAAHADVPAGDRPNVVVIVADDLGLQDVGFTGSGFHETPNLDGLAATGVRFTQAYASSPVCSPTRASLLTGKHPARLNLTDWLPGSGNRPSNLLLQVEDVSQLPLTETTVAERLERAGFVTAHIGKWHLGGPGFLPEDQGFALNVGGTDMGSPPSYFHPYCRGERCVPGLRQTDDPDAYLTDRLANAAASFIRQHADTSFYLQLWTYSVHLPLQAPEEDAERYARKATRMGDYGAVGTAWRPDLSVRRLQRDATYAAMVEAFDRAVGTVLEALDEQGLEDRTLIIVTSDNGGLAVWPSSRGAPPTAALPLRGGKGWLYEGGLRVPLLIRWPESVPPGTSIHEPVSSVDLAPTILDAIGLASEAAQDGESLLPLLKGKKALERDALHWHYPHYHGAGGAPSGAIRSGRYKLIEHLEDGRVQLFDLRTDPGETNDLSTVMPSHAADLARRLAAWREEVGAQMPRPNPAFSGHP